MSNLTFCEKCGNPTAAYKYDDKFLCCDCLFDALEIHEYIPPQWRCSNCNRKMDGGHYPHYIDDYDNHFCSKECVLDFRDSSIGE